MKLISTVYNLVFGALQNLGMSAAITSELTYISLIAIAIGLLIASPEIAIIVALLIAIVLSVIQR